ncbi:MAG: hypothetical protein HY738_08395 [Bacteroidia bacterium]|nr:hypothetical protein [Bacteroidia bacterium]
MKKIQIFIVIAALMLVAGKSSDFEIITATVQQWHGGTPGSPGGINYSFTFLMKKPSEKLKIDQLWVKDKLLKIEQVIFMGATDAGAFKKNDTVHYRASQAIPALAERLGKKDNVSDDPAPPFEYNGEGLIGYTVGCKRKYKTVENFKMLKPFNAP